MCRLHNRAEKRRMEKLEVSQMAANLEMSSELARYKERCQKLEKMASRVPDEMSPCECGDTFPMSSTASRTGFVCYNCGGECAKG